MIEDNKNSEEQTEKKIKKKSVFDKILFLILIILIAFLVLKFIDQDENKEVKISEINENKTNFMDVSDISLKGRKINALAVHHKNCDHCFNVGKVFATLKNEGADLSINEKYIEDNPELEKLIKELEITKLPTILLSGETDGLETLSKFEKKGEYLVLETPQPPYYYIPTKKIVGYVDLILLKDKECTLCPKIGELSFNMEWDEGVAFMEKKAVYLGSEEADLLVKKYDITKVPTYIFKGDLLEYEFIAKSWDKVGSIESDGALVLRLVNPPYMNPQTDELEGVVDIVFIVDGNCDSNCIDSEKTAQTMKEQFNLVFGTSRTINSDSEEGKQLVDKYDIDKLNAFVMSDEAQKYPGLMIVWNQTGKIADDGSLILG